MIRLAKVGLVAVLSLGPLAAAGLAAAAPALPSPAERRAALRPLYDALQSDAQFAALKADYAQRQDPAALDRMLSYLRISPLDLLEIDMQVKTYDLVVPQTIYRQHQRWLVLHPDLALEWWGQAALDAARGQTASATVSPESERQEAAATVGTNRDPAFDEATDPDSFQGEIQIGANPHNLNQVVAAANTWDTTSACSANQQIISVVYSADGGTTWQYTCAPGVPEFVSAGLVPSSGTGSCTGAGVTAFGSDPAVYWNDANEVFLNYMLICNKPAGLRPSMVVARSTDGGANWTPQGMLSNGFSATTFNDKNFYVVDNNPGSPFYGRHYSCWDRNNDEKFAFSVNDGAAWTEKDLPEGESLAVYSDVGCDIAVQKNGTVHVTYSTFKTGPPIHARLYYTHSTDGGSTWSTPVMERDLKLVSFTGTNCPPADNSRCLNPSGSIDVDNSGGVCDGTIYVSFTDFVTSVSDTDVYVTRSVNGGTSFETGVRVNDVTTGNQFHPFLVVDQDNGVPVLAWHDARSDGANKKVDYFVSRSKDCGVSWEANTQISSASSEFDNSGVSYTDLATTDNALANPNQFGEYLGLDVQSGRAYVSWTDTRQYFPTGGGSHAAQRENMAFALVDFGDLFSDGFETSSTSAWSVVGP